MGSRSDRHTHGPSSCDVRVIPKVPSPAGVRARVRAQAEVSMGPLREIPHGQVAIEKNNIPGFTCVEPMTRDLCRDTEQ